VAAQKKSKVASERDEGARSLWRWLASRFDVRRLVFVDESGVHTSMDRLRSRAPRGERAYYGKVPRNRGKNTTLIASMSLSGMGEAMCIQGATDAAALEVYIESTSWRRRFRRGKWWCSTTSGRTGPGG
jgi:hypothetical protein